MNEKSIAYIDQQSYHGLARYDANLLSSIKKNRPDLKINFYCSTLFNSKVPSDIKIFPFFNYSEQKSSILKAYSYSKSILKIIKDIYIYKIKIVHIQWVKLPIIDLLFIFILKFFLSTKVVHTIHNPQVHEKISNFSKFLISLIYKLLNEIVVHTESSYEKILNTTNIELRKVSIQPHGLMKLEALSKYFIPRKEIIEFVEKNSINFLFLGNGNQYKGLDILLEAWNSASKFNNSKCGLIIAGKVNQKFKDSLKSDLFATSNQLVIDEILSDEEVEYILNASDIVILPHRFISQSGVFMVALAYEKLVICSPRQEFKNTIEKASCGWIFYDTPSSLAEVLKNIYQTPKVIEYKKEKYNKKILDDIYSWDQAAEVLVKIYMSLEKDEMNEVI
jgi:glycosyltransferase involved in cell wall biosynthesis